MSDRLAEAVRAIRAERKRLLAAACPDCDDPTCNHGFQYDTILTKCDAALAEWDAAQAAPEREREEFEAVYDSLIPDATYLDIAKACAWVGWLAARGVKP